MKSFNSFRYFLVLIDAYTNKIFSIAMRRKTAAVVGKALEHILDSIPSPITKLQSDYGGEFIGLKSLYLRRSILFSTRHSSNKAALAEHAVFLIKVNYYLKFANKNST